MPKKKIITIVGLMGAGKTTIGSRLAQILKYYFIDSDQEIEDSEHRSIADIFAQNGEKYFREIEAKTIQEIVNRDEEIVLSLGGGAFINQETRKILKQKNTRQVLEDLAKIRYPIYQEADFDFDTTHLTHEDIIEKIINKLKIF